MSQFETTRKSSALDPALPPAVQARAAGKSPRTAGRGGGSGPVVQRSVANGSSASANPALHLDAQAAALGTFANQPVQRFTDPSAPQAGADALVINSGELTATGEGNDQQTRYIHWPNTAASGVTLGKGYDIGSRSAAQVIEELTAVGMGQDQASKISRGAGLKGNAAGTFVAQNKSSVGEISRDVQYALLSNMLEEYTQRARDTATSTRADGDNRNAAGRERKEGKAAGTYVMSEVEWDGLHPAMVEFLTDLIYQGGYYGYDRVAKINEALKASNGDHLAQFKGVRELFTNGYMDRYAGAIGEGRGARGASETFYGQEVDYEGEFRRNSLRLAYLNHVISALEAGKTVSVQRGGGDEAAAGGESGATDSGAQVEEPPQLEGSQGGASAGPSGEAAAGAQQPATTHVVERGESLLKLSERFSVSVDALKAANAGQLKRWGNVEGFNAGDTIKIPSAGGGQESATSTTDAEAAASFPYVVQRGEGLIALAGKFGVTVAALRASNADKLKRWGNVEGFNAGETIVIPTAQSASSGGPAPEIVPEPEPKQPETGGSDSAAPDSSKPAWISVAEAEIGQKEIKGAQHNQRVVEYHSTTGKFGDDETPWCASFVNWVLQKAGQSGTGSAMAMSFASYGQALDRPAYGSIAVFSYGGGKGHVGFVVGKQGDRLLVLGGNQSDQVKVSSFGTGQIAAYVVPSGYEVPAAAFNLDESADKVEAGGGLAATR